MFFGQAAALIPLALLINLPAIAAQIWLMQDPARAEDPVASLASSAIGFLCQALLAAPTVVLVFSRLGGHACTLGQALTRGFQNIWSVVLVCLVQGSLWMLVMLPGLGVVEPSGPSAALLGILVLAFFVVAMIITLGMYVAVPAAAVEGLGPLDAIRRSWGLTRGNRLKILLMLVLFVVLAALLFGMIGLVGGILAVSAGVPEVLMVFVALATALGPLFSAINQGVVYRDLRVLHDGVPEREVLAVFD
jgi:hypothetical protein